MKNMNTDTSDNKGIKPAGPDRLDLNEDTLPLISQLAEQIPGGFFVYHADGNQELIYFNSRLPAIFGCENDETFRTLTGNSFKGIVYPEDYARTEADIKEQIRQDSSHTDHIRYRFIRRDGSIGMLDDYGHFSHSESFGDIYSVFVQDITEEYLKEQRMARMETLNRTLTDYEGVFLIDCVNDTRRTFHDRLSGAANYTDTENFSGAFSRYVENCVCETDRSMMRQFTDPANILKALGAGRELSVSYRDRTTAVHHFYEMKLIRYSDTEVLQSFRENDAETVNSLLFEKLKENYFAIFEVDLETGLLRSYKGDPLHIIGNEGETSTLSGVMNRLASFYEGETRAFFERNSRTEYIRKAFAKADKAVYTCRSARGEETRWVDITGIVFKRNEAGEPDLFCLAFNYLDEQAAEVQEMRERLEKALAVAKEESQRNEIFIDTFNAGKWSYEVSADDEVVAADYGDKTQGHFNVKYTGKPMGWVDLVHPEDKEQVLHKFMAAIHDRSCATPYNVTYRIRGRDGQYRWVKAAGRMIRREDGSGELFGMDLNITEEIRQQETHKKQLEEALTMAQAASQAKTEFLFNMSHDVRTPMNAILGFTGMAKKHIGNQEKVTDYLDKIDASGKQLLGLINQVLEMARIESGKTELQENPVNVMEQYNTSVTVLAEQARDKGLEFHHSLTDITHMNVFADAAKMSSITLNITGNAIKYTPRGGRIDYALREVPARKPGYATFVFTVADTGIGMSRDFLEKIYEPFSRAQNTTVSEIQGTGLGMSIVKELVDRAGGSIEVQSEPGKGTRFDVTMDFRINRAAGQRENEKHGTESAAFAGKRVLLVEDNAMNREIGTDILEEEGFEVESAVNGADAVDLVKQKGPDCYDFILMDIQMPVMNGYEATRAIRQLPGGNAIPMIAVSANAFDEDRQKSAEAGMNAHIAKPIDIGELLRVMREFI